MTGKRVIWKYMLASADTSLVQMPNGLVWHLLEDRKAVQQ